MLEKLLILILQAGYQNQSKILETHQSISIFISSKLLLGASHKEH